MTVEDLRELFGYDDWANERLFLASTGVGASAVGGALRDAVAHIVLEEWVWLCRSRGESRVAVPAWARGDIRHLRGAYSSLTQERHTFLSSLAPQGLDTVAAFWSLEGNEHRHSVRDMLLHVLNHSSYHRGQIAKLLREAGAQVPETDFVVYREG